MTACCPPVGKDSRRPASFLKKSYEDKLSAADDARGSLAAAGMLEPRVAACR